MGHFGAFALREGMGHQAGQEEVGPGMGETGAEVLIFEPTIQGAAAHFGEARGFGQGKCGGKDGKGHPPAGGRGRFFVLCHFGSFFLPECSP